MDQGPTPTVQVSLPLQGPGNTLARILLPEIALGLVYLLSALAAIASTRVSDLALIWPSNAIAAGVLIRLHRVRWALAMPTLLVACVAANLIMNDGWALSLGLSLVNMAEIAAMVYAFRVVIRYPFPDITIPQASYMTLIMGFMITGCAALCGGAMLFLLVGDDFWKTVLSWWASDAIGACVLIPPIVLFSRRNLARLARPRYLGTNLVIVPVCLLCTLLAIKYVAYPFVLVGIAPMVAAFRIGAFGTSLLSVLNCAAIIVLWMLDIRPIGMDGGLGGGALAGLPILALIATMMPPVAVGLGTDERRRASRTLRASERRFRESMEHSPLGMVLLDRAGKCTFANPTMQEMLGYPIDNLSGMDINSMSHPDELESIWQGWNQLLDGELESFKKNWRLRRSDGSWLWVHCAVSLARDDAGVPMHFIAQVESLEERRYAAARLAKEREFLRTTLDSISDAVVTADAEGRITYLNEAAEGLIGQTLARTARRQLRDVLPLMRADSKTPATDIIDRCRAGKTFVQREEPCSLQRPDGSTCYVNDSATPVLDADGELNGFVVVLRDVTLSLQRTRELHHRANHDALTELLNRAAFERSLHNAFALARTAGTASSLIVIDLDRFKAVNDEAGHAAGDAVLRHVAAALRRSVRPADVVGRLGGDEFAVLLIDCDPGRALEIAGRVCDELNPLRTVFEGRDQVTGASLGLAHSRTEQADPGEWTKQADQACYEAKHDGRGVVRVWEPRAPAGAAPEPGGS